MKKISVRVDVNPQHYEVIIGNNLFEYITTYLKEQKPGSRYAIITDSTVKPLLGEKLLAIFGNAGLNTRLFDFPAGEIHKNRETKNNLDDALLSDQYGRDSVIIALGGGVVGDVAGFVAATYMRGIPFIQVPTTIVSQADSSIGGKTGIDAPQGKNLIGAFHHPRSVFIDISTLDTLDERNYLSGMAEIIKHGLIMDRELFDFFTDNLDTILSRKATRYTEIMTELLFRNCRVKNEVVAKDTKESNLRKILNYGHTIGHAVEHLSGYRLFHGEAVAIGMAAEAFFAHKLGFLQETDYSKQITLLKNMKLPVVLPGDIEAADILEILRYDKKARNNVPEFVLIDSIGRVKRFKDEKTTTTIDEGTLKNLLDEFSSQH